jgi:uncharacterized membrane protein YphA (DoxX/SURF4 family)
MNEDKKQFKYIGWLFIVIVMVSTWSIRFFEELSFPFLIVLLAEFIIAMMFASRFTRGQLSFARIIIGLLFMYSGFVKGVDPVGTEYRIVDYFIAYGTEWAFPFALPLSVIMNASEFVLGVLLLFNVRIRTTSWLVLLMMALFTLTTLNDALNNPVPDCGCFGDAIILTNWQTFYKNLTINALLMLVFLSQRRIKPSFGKKTELVIAFAFILLFIWFEIFNIRHLPVIDFRDWKVGNKMSLDNPQPLKYYLTYKNSTTGEEKEYVSPDYPYNDSVWMSQWEFVSQRVEDPNPRVHDLRIQDEGGNDFTSQIIENPDFQFVLVAFDIHKANWKKLEEIKAFSDLCYEDEISFIILTSSLPEEVEFFKQKSGLDIDFYYADDITQMAMIRSNPGLILLKESVVLRKWHYNDFPEYADAFVEN